jgi:hypothetical protein
MLDNKNKRVLIYENGEQWQLDRHNNLFILELTKVCCSLSLQDAPRSGVNQSRWTARKGIHATATSECGGITVLGTDSTAGTLFLEWRVHIYPRAIVMSGGDQNEVRDCSRLYHRAEPKSSKEFLRLDLYVRQDIFDLAWEEFKFGRGTFTCVLSVNIDTLYDWSRRFVESDGRADACFTELKIDRIPGQKNATL